MAPRRSQCMGVELRAAQTPHGLSSVNINKYLGRSAVHLEIPLYPKRAAAYPLAVTLHTTYVHGAGVPVARVHVYSDNPPRRRVEPAATTYFTLGILAALYFYFCEVIYTDKITLRCTHGGATPSPRTHAVGRDAFSASAASIVPGKYIAPTPRSSRQRKRGAFTRGEMHTGNHEYRKYSG